ncbi:MAG: transporter substrate-binding domain-containing protein [Alphaproteobacteria bacterium]|nr:transporter substrate-binding domain-containing protein [Alphaproteobacteria bacterium]
MRILRYLVPFLSVVLFGAATSAGTLDTIKKKGWLTCGVSQGLPGFSVPDAKGNWTGIDVDFCRAVAAVALGSPDKVKFRPLSTKEAFTALQFGEIHILSRNVTWTQTRDSALGVNFAGILYYDGQGFMVRRDLGVRSARELDGAAVCVNSGSTTELNLSDYFRSHGMKYTPVVFEKSDEVLAAYRAGRCDVFSTDQSGLYAQRLKLPKGNVHMILPEVISKEPLGPAVRQGDDQWFNIVRWTLFALIGAEELGVTKSNVTVLEKKTRNPAVRRFVGTEGKAGANLGLDPKWAVRAITAVGNYGELFERHLGNKSRLKISRDLNRLWNKGGLHYAPPIR